MALVTKLSEVCDRLVLLFRTQAPDLGIEEKAIFYGDQERIPISPAVCIEPGEKNVEMYGAGRMTELDLIVYVLAYHSEIQDLETNRRDADRLGETIADLLNADSNFFGLAIHCFVSNISSGYATKKGNTLRASRITFRLKSQERLPNQP
jgi:hypothetical protein